MAFMSLSGKRTFLSSKFTNDLKDKLTILSGDGQYDWKKFDKAIKVNRILGYV